jgi:hypothetical protein
MIGRRVERESAGWGTVVAVALLGLALAALVVLMPWRVGEAPVARNSLQPSSDVGSPQLTGDFVQVTKGSP